MKKISYTLYINNEERKRFKLLAMRKGLRENELFSLFIKKYTRKVKP